MSFRGIFWETENYLSRLDALQGLVLDFIVGEMGHVERQEVRRVRERDVVMLTDSIVGCSGQSVGQSSQEHERRNEGGAETSHFGLCGY
jgi:hypothetical protein